MMIGAIYGAVSCLVGYIMGCWITNRRHRRREAPAPDYDRLNPINARREDRTVTINGYEWHVISP